jgi:hypothetical protein
MKALNLNIDSRPGNQILSKIREKYRQSNETLLDLDSAINRYTDWDETRTNEIFQKFMKGNEDYSKIIENTNIEEKEIMSRYNNLILSEKLLHLNLDTSESNIEFYNRVRNEIPKYIEELSFITKKELLILEKLKEESSQQKTSVIDIQSYYKKILHFYKAVSQLSCKKVDSNILQITVDSISKINKNTKLIIHLEVKDKIIIRNWSPREVNIEKFLNYIDDNDLDLSLFLGECILEAIKVLN